MGIINIETLAYTGVRYEYTDFKRRRTNGKRHQSID